MYFGKTSRQVHDSSFRVSSLKRSTPHSFLDVLSLLVLYSSWENLTSQATSTDLASPIFYRKSPIRHNLKRKIVIKCGIFFPAFYLLLSTFKLIQCFGKPGQQGPGAIAFASSDQLAMVSWIIFF